VLCVSVRNAFWIKAFWIKRLTYSSSLDSWGFLQAFVLENKVRAENKGRTWIVVYTFRPETRFGLKHFGLKGLHIPVP